MKPSLSWRSAALLLVLVAMCSAGTIFAADSPPPAGLPPKVSPAPSPEQAKQLQTLQNTAAQNQRSGRINEAVAALEQLLALQRSVSGDDSGQAVGTLQALAGLHEREEAFAIAFEERQEALTLLTKQLGDKHWRTIDERLRLEYVRMLSRMSREQRRQLKEADRLWAKANALEQRGKCQAAVLLLRERRDIDCAILAASQRRVGEDFRDLARVHWRLDEVGIADGYARRAMRILQPILGENHPELADVHNLLGLIASRRQDGAEALAHYTKAADFWKASSGEQSSDYAVALHNLALQYKEMRDLKRAESLFCQSLAIKETPAALSQLALLLQGQQRFDEAESLFDRELRLREKLLQRDQPDYLECLNRLANLAEDRARACLEREDFAAARKSCGRCIDWTIRGNGQTHWLVARRQSLLAHVDRLAAAAADGRLALKAAAAKFAEAVALSSKRQFAAARKIAEDVLGRSQATAWRKRSGHDHCGGIGRSCAPVAGRVGQGRTALAFSAVQAKER